MNLRKIKFGATLLLMATVLSGCRPPLPSTPGDSSATGSGDGSATSVDPGNRTKIQFWTGFGGAVNSVLEPLIARFETLNPDVEVEYESKGGYPNLRQAIVQSVSNGAYPHIANGYPDHFADYANSQILLNLDTKTYIRNDDPNIGVDVDQYLPSYMTENTTLSDNMIVGLPFNKSTEIMVANQTFFDVAAAVENDPTIKVPETWQELEVVGLKLKNVIRNHGWAGKYVKHDGTTINAGDVPKTPTPELIASIAIDLTNLADPNDFVPFSWDSTSNFFITVLRQWDAEYTRRGATFHNGTIEFHRGDNRAKTLAALAYFKDLADRRIVGIPETYGEELYSSKPFREGRLALTISSSAGVKENLPDVSTDYPFKISVNHIPYNANIAGSQYVISQGTNLALFAKGRGNDPAVQQQRMAAWRLLRFLTYEVNHEFGRGTSYFPVTDGTLLAEDESDPRYQDYKLYIQFLQQSDEGALASEVAVRNTARLQANVYQEKDAQGQAIWHQFVDPAFIGSARIRLEVENLIPKLFHATGAPEKSLNEVVSQLGDFI